MRTGCATVLALQWVWYGEREMRGLVLDEVLVPECVVDLHHFVKIIDNTCLDMT